MTQTKKIRFCASVSKRVAVPALHYSMDYVSEISDGDEVVEQDGVTIVIDPKAILYLLGTEMDYVEEKFSAGFKFNNPNETSACGCGESVEITPISELEIK